MKGLAKKILFTGAALAGICFLFLTVNVEAKVKHTVTFMYGTKSSVQQVVDGGNAVIPTDTAVNGFTFLGWTDSAFNVKTDKLILGMYAQNTPYAPATNSVSTIKKVNDNVSAPFMPWWDGTKGVPGVTCVVRWYNGNTNEVWKTEVVPYGATLPDPADPCISGLEFVGWEGSWQNITEDRAIRAWYYKTHRVRVHNPMTNEFEDKWVRDGEILCVESVYTPYFEGYAMKGFDIDGKGVDRIGPITCDREVSLLYGH